MDKLSDYCLLYTDNQRGHGTVALLVSTSYTWKRETKETHFSSIKTTQILELEHWKGFQRWKLVWAFALIEYNRKGTSITFFEKQRAHRLQTVCFGCKVLYFRFTKLRPNVTISFVFFTKSIHQASSLHLIFLVYCSVFCIYSYIYWHWQFLSQKCGQASVTDQCSQTKHRPKSHNPRRMSQPSPSSVIFFQDSPEYLLAAPWARVPGGGHGGAAALWELSAFPGWPLRRGHLSSLQLPRSSRRSVRQVWAAHQRCGAQGERTTVLITHWGLLRRFF